jgi:hypothetical protein
MENNPNKNSRTFILWAGLTFCLPMALLYGYSLLEYPISIFGFELKKITQSEPNPKIEEIKPIFDKQTLNKSTRDSIQAIDSVKKNSKKDSLLIKTISEKGEVEEVVSLRDSIPRIKLFGNDSVSHRVLIMGDSESGGLCFQLYDYCQENGHNLVAALTWYSASIFNLAYADTVNDVIKKYKPTYIFIVVGLNEMYAKDLNNRRKAAQILAKKISGIPYTWIGPANYMEDYGINQVFKESAEPGTYYLTKQLDLPKGGDKRHPSKVGYRIWMDSLAVWLQTDAKYKIKMDPPIKRNRLYRSKIITLNAAKYRGY